MSFGNLILEHAHIVTPLGHQPVKGADMQRLCEIKDALIIVEDGIITSIFDSASDALCHPKYEKYERINLEGRIVLPGFVDSHTHAVFGGFRPDEFEWRLKGESYMSIMQRGGGIQSTVNATRDSSREELVEKTAYFLRRMIEMGVTTVEIKSGYGLDTATEEKMLECINSLQSSYKDKIGIVSTFLGAHAVPREYQGHTSDYLRLMSDEMLSRFSEKAEFCDIFCEKGVFEIDESREFLTKAKEKGYKLKLHADEIVTLGGAELAVELGAVSADHLLHISAEGVKRLSESSTIATLLPLTAFALREDYAPARKMIDGGCAVALATDLNPGSCFSGSIPLTIALACINMRMSIEEVITALTINGAAALDKADRIGSIEVGKDANFAILNCDNYKILPYYIGMNSISMTVYRGSVVSNNINN